MEKTFGEILTPGALIDSLSIEDTIDLLHKLRINDIRETSTSLIIPTYCHNSLAEHASHKLYFYKENKRFRCYTECDDLFNIVEFVKRFMRINTNNDKFSYYDAFVFIQNSLDLSKYSISVAREHVELPMPEFKETKIKLPTYDDFVLNTFIDYAHPMWIAEGITNESQKRFNIKFSISQNKIIVPHYDIDGDLIGIRARALNPQDIEFMKYGPITVSGITYSHPLSLNLYGLVLNQQAIRTFKKVIVYESEKSVMLDYVYNGENSCAVACCGSSLNKAQVMMLARECGVSEIIIAFDREYEIYGSEQCHKYREKLKKICEKYSIYADFSYIFDIKNLLQYKQSPADNGAIILNKLIKERKRI